MDIELAFGAFAALFGAWILVERRPAPRPVGRPTAQPEPTRYGFLRRLARDDAA